MQETDIWPVYQIVDARAKILRDFEIQKHHQIPARRRDLKIINKKKKERRKPAAIPVNHIVKIQENQKKEKYLAKELKKKKLWKMKVAVIPIVSGALGTIFRGLIRGLELGNLRTNRDHPNYNIVKIGQNTEKGPGDLRKLAVTQQR